MNQEWRPICKTCPTIESVSRIHLIQGEMTDHRSISMTIDQIRNLKAFSSGLMFHAPVTVSADEIEEGLQILDAAFGEVLKSHSKLRGGHQQPVVPL